MQTVQSIMEILQSKGSEKFQKTYVRHGVPPERTFGVSNADLKLIAKTIKGQQALACGLFQTGNLDAMYLAGLVADGAQLSRAQLQSWAEGSAGLRLISEYTVPFVAVEHAEARQLALAWMESKEEHVASAGWCTYSGLVATQADKTLDMVEIEKLLGKVVREIDGAKNRVRYTMNGFVIAVGTYVRPMLAKARKSARQIGAVSVEMGGTACKVALASASLAGIKAEDEEGKKRKTIRC